MTFDTVIVWKD